MCLLRKKRPKGSKNRARFDQLVDAFRMSAMGSKTQGSRSRADHIRLDYEKLLRIGIRGLIDEIKEKKQALDLKNAARSFPNA